MKQTANASAPKSYTSTRLGVLGRLSEFRNLYRSQVHTVPARAAEIMV